MKVAFLFLPPWDPKYPSYTMALFKASTTKAGHDFIGFDLNVDLYNAVKDDDKKFWDDRHANLWDIDQDEIIQKYTHYLDSYIENIITNQIDLYAISIIKYSRYLALYIAHRIKELFPNALIIIGGPQCFPAYDGLKILENKYVDAICTGEGDAIWPKVLEHFNKKRNLQINIPGISYKKTDKTIVDNGVPELVTNLDSIPFADYSDIDFAKHANKYHFSIMTSRGCINTCAFCSERPNFYKYRFRSAENIFNEIVKSLCDIKINSSINFKKEEPPYRQNIFNKIIKRYYHRYKLLSPNSFLKKTAKHLINKFMLNNSENRFGEIEKPIRGDLLGITPYISFNDSLINGTPKELEKLCNLIIDKDLNFSWGGMALIRKEMTYDLFVKMKEAGCHNVAWGMESGCQDVLDLMHKRFFNMDLAKGVIKSAYKAGIRQSISLIVGFPGETEEMFLETKKFLIDFKDYFEVVSVHPMMIVRNSIVYDKPEKFGVKCTSDVLKWETTDGINNYDIRLKRVAIVKSLLNKKAKTINR